MAAATRPGAAPPGRAGRQEPAAARPVVLGPNQPARFYRGGAAIAAFRGLAAGDEYVPEDWLASTTTRYGAAESGLSRLPDGRSLRTALAADPVPYLGSEHVAAFGADPGVLVKLLDAGQRLPVHVHPDRSFAARHLRCRYGKTEAWIVLSTEGPDPCAYLGSRRDVDVDTLAGMVRTQDTGALLGGLNRLPVAPGDTILVPAGTPHATGKGVFLLELQEPTDLSVLLEWTGFGLDGPSYLGLEAPVALDCVHRLASTAARLAGLRSGPASAPRAGGPAPVSVLPAAADPYFRAELLEADDPTPVRLDAGFGILVVTDGAGLLVTSEGGAVAVRRGSTVLVPWVAGTAELHGTPAVRAYRARPPVQPPPPLSRGEGPVR